MRRTAAIDTARLHLRPYRDDDLDDLLALWTDAGVRRYLWDDEVIGRDTAARVMQQSVASTRLEGFGHWAVCRRDAKRLIGFCGFRRLEGDGEIELLYGLAPTYWHQGLATEAARAMLRWGFAEHGWARVLAITDAPNTASIRVMQRLGMTFLKRTAHHGLDSVFYAISRDARAPDGEPFEVAYEDQGESSLPARARVRRFSRP